MVETYFFYTMIFVLAASFAYIAQYGNGTLHRMWARILCFMCLVVPASLRYGIGTDYFSYRRIYENNFPDYLQRLEPGFVFIGQLCQDMGLTYQMFLAVIAIITYGLTCFCIPRKYIFAVIVFYILSFTYLESYNIVRQSLAISVLLCAFSQLYRNHNVKGVLLLACASLIHFSALILIPILMISLININNYLRVFLIIAVVFIGTNQNFLDMLISFAISINPRNVNLALMLRQTELNFGVKYMIMALPTILILLNTKKILMQNNGNFILNANAIYLGVTFLAYVYAIMGRFVHMLFIIPLFSIQVLYNANKRYAKIYNAILITCFSVLFIRYIEHHQVSKPGYKISPYTSIFNMEDR